MPLADAHTHLDHYPAAELPEILARAAAANVGLMVLAGTTLESSRNCVDLANRYAPFYAGVGLHPSDLRGPLTDDTYSELKRLVEENSKVVCVSEVGLDFQPSSPPRDVQDQAFRGQIRLALELDKPIIFHSRESHPAAFATLRGEGADRVGGVMHYFQGTAAEAHQAIDLGFFISLARPLLRLPELQGVARALPLEHIVLETDSAPQPFKKYRRNWTEPRHLADVAAKLAELKGVDVEEVAKVTTGNVLKLLGLGTEAMAPQSP